MRAPFMAGDFPFPVKYGYATVGVLDGGQTVFTLHPHQTVFDVPADAAVLVPPSIPAARAVLAANMESALNAVWDAGEDAFGKIAVVGAGVVGALTGLLCRTLATAEVTLVDINPTRARIAEGLGLRFALPDRAPTECDLVFHASASSAGLATALEPCRALVWFAAHAQDALPEEARLAALQAKAHRDDVGREVARLATEVHGGMGFTDLQGLHYWFKRIDTNRQLLGTPEWCRHEAARVQGWISG